MTLEDLITEYTTLPKFCDNVNYSDKKAVEKNNKSIKRMYEIVETIKSSYGEVGTSKLIGLLDIEDHRTNLWIATHLLERVAIDKKTEEKSLEIIKKVSATDKLLHLGYIQWLKDFEQNRGK